MGYTATILDRDADDDGIRLTPKDIAEADPVPKPVKRKPINWKPWKRWLVRLAWLIGIVFAVGFALALFAFWLFGQCCGAGSSMIAIVRGGDTAKAD